MTTLAKTFIVIFACGFVLVILAVLTAAYWWSHHSREIFQKVESTYTEGTEYGKKTDNQGCLTEALSRYRQNRGITGSMSANLFVRGCLESSRPAPGFCDSVPRPFDILKSAQWQAKQCKDAGLSDSYCGQIFSQVQQYCETRESKQK
jgi:hypothetical protein